jgi:hypothetical protein
MAQPNTASATPAKAAKPGHISIPSLLIDKHLSDFHGSHLKVCLALCAQQARAGRNKPFSYSVPKLIIATGLCERAIGTALGALDKNGLIDRQKNPGPTGNRYRILWEDPAVKNKKHAQAASKAKRRPSAGSRESKKPKPPATNTTTIHAGTGKLVVRSPNLFGDYFDPQEPAIAAPATKRRRPRQPKQPLPDVGKRVQLIDDAELAPPPEAKELRSPEAGRPEKKNQVIQPTPEKTQPAPDKNPPATRDATPPPSVASSTQPHQPPARKAIPSPVPPTANTTQPQPPSSIPQSSAPTAAVIIHKLASRIASRPADPTMIRDLQNAAHNDLELLRGVLEEIDKENGSYDPGVPGMFLNEVSRRCQERRRRK